ncbi:MAG: LPS export ABC transporter periplasmic protein LptC [Cytophagaceae bacterium]|nr:LPS export ABC transporter periplasmic protein LptC [Cytophagaceae bacterium]
MKTIFFIGLFGLAFSSCFKDQSPDAIVTYNGPFMELNNIETLYSDSAVLRVKLKAARQIELQNGDRTFPNGVYVEFYNESGVKTSTLKSNYGHYNKQENLYTVRGNVIIENLEEKNKLNTEELKWDPETQKINTTKFVRIETPEEIITGEGLEATQDFSDYTILRPKGRFTVE